MHAIESNMDASNPVRDSTRRTVAEIIAGKQRRKRQNLNLLTELAQGSPRYSGETLDRRELTEKELLEEVRRVKAVLERQVDPTPITDEQIGKALDKFREAMPICGLVNSRGDPFHPPGSHQIGGDVSAMRTFGGSTADEVQIRDIVLHLQSHDVTEAIGTFQHTHGTSVGLETRLQKQMNRKCVSIRRDPNLGVEVNDAQVKRWIDELFPIDLSKLPDYRRDIRELVDEITTSNKASAGAPLWAPKGDCMDRVVNDVLPVIVDSIKDGKLSELYKEQPELFLVEVKNKTDRYEDPIAKTRPYVCVGAHWGSLFSVLSQGICSALETFDNGRGVNAYGFSAAHGGLTRLRSWAMNTKKREMVSAHYGDDTDLYYRNSKGLLLRAAPDFSQMDGSVDHDTVRIVIDWVLDKYKQAYPDQVGEHEFWKAVGSEWLRQATDPELIVDGKTIWKKRSKDGLLSGIVGTTLFDTVKGAVSYMHYKTAARADPKLIEPTAATSFFKNLGLEIKEGTWEWKPVLERAIPDELWSEQKFLGMYYIYKQGPEEIQLVPWLPYEEWLRNLVVARTMPNLSKRQYTQMGRVRFDRLRGLMITGAFSNPEARVLLETLQEHVPARDVLMHVDADRGRGAQPELGHVSGFDFHWPTSQGWPTEKWCQDLYFTSDNQWGESWQPIFPTLEETLMALRKEDRTMKPIMRAVVDVSTKNPFKDSSAIQASVYIEEPEQEKPEEPVPKLAPIGGKGMGKVPTYNTHPTNRTVDGEVVRRETMSTLIYKRLATKASQLLVPPRKEHWDTYMHDEEWRDSNMPVHSKVFFEWYSRPQFEGVLQRAAYYGKSIHVMRSEFHRIFDTTAEPLRVYISPVVPLTTLASELGISPARCEKAVLKANCLVIGRNTKYCTRVALDEASREEAVERLQPLANRINSGTGELKQVLERLKGPDPLPLTSPARFYPHDFKYHDVDVQEPALRLTKMLALNKCNWKVAEDQERSEPGARTFVLLIGDTNRGFLPYVELNAANNREARRLLVLAMLDSLELDKWKSARKAQQEKPLENWADDVDEDEEITVKIYRVGRKVAAAYAARAETPVFIGDAGSPRWKASKTQGRIGIMLEGSETGQVVGVAHVDKTVEALSAELGATVTGSVDRMTRSQYKYFITQHAQCKHEKATAKAHEKEKRSRRSSKGCSAGSSSPCTSERSSSSSSWSSGSQRARTRHGGSAASQENNQARRRFSDYKSKSPRLGGHTSPSPVTSVRKMETAKRESTNTKYLRGNKRGGYSPVLDGRSNRKAAKNWDRQRATRVVVPNE
nr:putative RdRp [Rhodnius prolixus virus 3]